MKLSRTYATPFIPTDTSQPPCQQNLRCAYPDMRELLAPILFDEDDWEAAAGRKESVVSPAKQSEKAKNKANKKRTSDNLPVHTFQTLLDDLATIVKNTISTTIGSKSFVFEKINQATAIQQRAIDLLGISMICTQ